MLPSISGMLPEEIHSFLNLDKTYRSKQIFKWISSGARTFDEMSNLSKDLRTALNEKACVFSSKIARELHDPDGTIKLQIELFDNRCIEAVLLTDAEDRKTACISSQVGCAMGCKFCQTGKLGFARNLEPNEIVEQFFFLEKIAGTIDNIVFMGMGEPLCNLPAVRKSIEVLSHPAGRNLSKRRITISTSGVISSIYDLAENGPHVRLAVSLTTADEDLRKEIMPVTNANSLPELKKAIAFYTEKTNTRCTLEAALLHNTNTGKESAKRLIDFAKNLNVHFNLIPWNPVEGLPFTEPTTNEVNELLKILEKNNISTTLRTRRGRKIGGACGQLGKTNVS